MGTPGRLDARCRSRRGRLAGARGCRRPARRADPDPRASGVHGGDGGDRWEPPRRLVLRHGGLVAGEGTWALTPEPDGTRFDWTEDVRLRVPVVGGAAAWLYAPVLRWLMRRGARGLRGAVIASGPSRR